MPAPLALAARDEHVVADFIAAQREGGVGAWRSTVQAARTFCGRVARAGGWNRWESIGLNAQVEMTRRAPRFVAWLLVTGRLVISAELLALCELRLGAAAARYRPAARAWFANEARQLGVESVDEEDVALQWSTLAKVTAVTGVLAEHVGTREFERARTALLTAFGTRGHAGGGRGIVTVSHWRRSESVP